MYWHSHSSGIINILLQPVTTVISTQFPRLGSGILAAPDKWLFNNDLFF